MLQTAPLVEPSSRMVQSEVRRTLVWIELKTKLLAHCQRTRHQDRQGSPQNMEMAKAEWQYIALRPHCAVCRGCGPSQVFVQFVLQQDEVHCVRHYCEYLHRHQKLGALAQLRHSLSRGKTDPRPLVK